ncbi:MAG TPA: AAA family ATPase [Acidimicrobiia bacterium]|nr:AAA family ATPase [Acidimicrobiia bacterium]
MSAPPVVVVTGQPAVGKSTVCARLAARRDVAAHVKADDLHRMIVRGGEWPSAATTAARRQLLTRTRSAAQVAQNLTSTGVHTFLDEVVALPEQLEILDHHIARAHWILLSASPAVIAERDAHRAKHTADAYVDLGITIHALIGDRATVIETDGLDPEATADLVEVALARPVFATRAAGPVWWLVEVTVAAEHRERFESLTREMILAAQEEPGTLVYERYRVDDTTFHFHERYESAAVAVRHIERFRIRFADPLASLITRRRFHLYGDVTSQLAAAVAPFGAITTVAWPQLSALP